MREAYIWFKANWWLPLASILVVMSYFAGNKGKSALKDMLKAQKDDYETQLRVMREQRLKEKKILEDYQKSLKLLQEKHRVREEEIKFENRAELMETIEKNKDKPVEEIADDFAKRFGLEKV